MTCNSRFLAVPCQAEFTVGGGSCAPARGCKNYGKNIMNINVVNVLNHYCYDGATRDGWFSGELNA